MDWASWAERDGPHCKMDLLCAWYWRRVAFLLWEPVVGRGLA